MRQGHLSAIEARCGVYLHGHPEVQTELRRLEAAVTAVSSRAAPAALIRILRLAKKKPPAVSTLTGCTGKRGSPQCAAASAGETAAAC